MKFHNFSQKELEDYIRCICKIQVGDKVIFYTDPTLHVMSVKSQQTSEAEVISVNRSAKLYYYPTDITTPEIPTIVLGSMSGKGGSFWSGNSGTSFSRLIPKDTSYIRFRVVDRQMLIKQIIKAE